MRITNCFALTTKNTNVVLHVKNEDTLSLYIVVFKEEKSAEKFMRVAGDLPIKFQDITIDVTDTSISINGTTYTAEKIITLE